MEVEELKKIIAELPNEEAKSLLFHVLLRLNLMQETDYSEKAFVYDVEKVYEMILRLSKERSEMKKEEQFQRVHILFGDSPAGSLKVALKTLGVNKVERVISFWDIFSIGPIFRLHEEVGEEARMDWMKNLMAEDFHEYKQRYQKTMDQILSIPENVPITIWVSESSHEQTGLRFVLHLLKNKTNEMNVINSTTTYAEHFNELNIEYVVMHTGEIPPEKLQVIYEQSQMKPSLSQVERKKLEREWLTLAENREALRIWKNGRIESAPEDYYDQFIIQRAKYLHRKPQLKGFMKATRLIGDVLGHLEQHVGDSFLEYRLKKLIKAGVFESEGSLEAMRFYSVRLK
ncbi:DUF1835 domain-containing protein [Bacillus sp. Hm123]|uniref:DUF1835 domain-containing protein n=1 Tax=Bacillus sp. Hm123 TaxID=3450745 RepID=UPI003F433123